jgi:hypothetical protein
MRYIATFLIPIAVFFSQPANAQQWEPFLTPPFPMLNIKLVALEDNIFLFTNNGLHRSTDGGEHWEQIRSYFSDNVEQVLQVNRNNNRLYWSEGLDTSNFNQLFSTDDFGNTWKLIGNVKAGVSAFIADTIYGSCYDGSGLCSKLGSANWKVLHNFPKTLAGDVFSVSAEGQHLWAATKNGIFHSPNAGYHWEQSLPMSGVQVTSNPNGMPTFLIKALNGEVVVTDEIKKRIYFTKDFGASWQEAAWYGKGLYNSDQHLFATDTIGALLLRFEGGGPANWKDLVTGAKLDIGLSGVGEHEGTTWLGSNYFGVVRKKDDDINWVGANGVPNTGGGRLRYQDGHLFVDDLIQTFSADKGVSWKQNLYNRYLDLWSKGNYNYSLSNTGNSTPVLRSLRNGRFEWEIYSTPPDFIQSTFVLGDTLLGFSPFTIPTKVLQSFDNGASWGNIVTLPAAFENTSMRFSQGKLYVIKDKSLYHSDDLGTSWQIVYNFPYKVDESVGRFFIVHDSILLSHPPLRLTFYSIDGGQTFDTLTTPQNFNTDAYRLRTQEGLLLLYMNEDVFYLSKDIGKTWSSIALPPGISQTQMGTIITDNSWTYGDNTLFFPGNWRLRLDAQRPATGKVFLDSNSNGQKDAGEQGLNNLFLKAAQSGALGTTYNDGDFSLLFGEQGDELSIANIPAHYAVSPASAPVPSGPGSIPPVFFAMQPQGTISDASVQLVAASKFRAGYDNTLYVNVKNAGTVPSNGQLKLALNPLLSVISATPAADAKVGDTLVWNYTKLAPLKERRFQVDVKTPIVPPGTPIFVKTETINGGDVDISNNIAVLNEQFVASYDPNDKSVSAIQVPANEADGEELFYTIRFQNLGNSETDFITVRDTLSAALDAASVRVLNASHPLEWRIEEGHILVFNFNPIRLAPAAVDSLRSQGVVQFAARLKPGLQVGEKIANTAYIYFDFNPAVVTNTVVTSIAVVATFEPSNRALPLDIFPNPAGSRATLRLPEGVLGTGNIELFSTDGRLVYATIAQGNAQEVDLSSMVAGTYWCRWTTAGKVFWGKLVVGK